MARKRPLRQQNRQSSKTTLLIVGEGADDQAFIKNMHQMCRTDHSDIRPKIEKQSGGSPGNIIDNVTRKYSHQAFDQRFIVLDADVPLSQQERDRARKHGYQIILWAPVCLEGALLEVLGERVDENEVATSLKRRLHPLLDGPHTDSKAYRCLFSRAVLEQATNESVVSVKKVIIQEPA
ncbi:MULTISPECIES: hypothetical protein [unclassified Halomonas]|uniref:hypothetical protein n=1 Tax=unclassified Halomonas TaxID=2609666 RepID=UPI004034CB6F